MSRICYFYATREDVLAVTCVVESSNQIKYVRSEYLTTPWPEIFRSAVEIPNLGIASHPSAVGCETFLISSLETAIRLEPLKTLSEEDVNHSINQNKDSLRKLIGVQRYDVNQLLNPDTISFRAGGIWKENILLHGGIGTASDSKPSLELMRRFKAAIKLHFTKIKAFYVGPEALELLKQGMRLTIAEQSPEQFNLKLD